jgi:hypothetical protein
MVHGKYLSLEEARKQGKLGQFARDQATTGDKRRFDKLFEAVVGSVRMPKQKGKKRPK